MTRTESKIEEKIMELLLERGPSKTICPSEVARALFPEDWREHMEEVRSVARALVKKDLIAITQAGQEVDPDNFKGAIRLRLK